MEKKKLKNRVQIAWKTQRELKGTSSHSLIQPLIISSLRTHTSPQRFLQFYRCSWDPSSTTIFNGSISKTYQTIVESPKSFEVFSWLYHYTLITFYSNTKCPVKELMYGLNWIFMSLDIDERKKKQSITYLVPC